MYLCIFTGINIHHSNLALEIYVAKLNDSTQIHPTEMATLLAVNMATS